MGLAYRVIPSLLCRGRQLVKGQKFDSWRSVGVAAQAVRIHQARNVDELCLLDIAATIEHRGPDLDLVRELSEVCFMPLTVGGGIKSVADIRALLDAGADKVAIGRGATIPGLINAAAARFGCQAIVVTIDAIGKAVRWGCGTPKQWAMMCEAMGAGELLLTSVEREGTLQGYDLDLVRTVSKAVDIPVIAHGGAGTYEHMREALEAGASAVAAGAMFQFTDQTPRGACEYLASQGVEVRL